VAAGIGIAVAYALSPLTVVVVLAGAFILPLFGRGLPHAQRRWLTAIVLAAMVARLLAVGAVFVRNLPYHDRQFVGATSGDEAYAMSRALRTRDIAIGSATNKYDYFVTFDEYGRNRYVTALTAAQMIFGPTPYSLRLLNALLFIVGALALFRLCHTAFGALPAYGGLVVVLFWPTLFAWSISLLKEPLYFVAGAVMLTGAVTAVRRNDWPLRWAAFVALVLAAAIVQDLRPGALILLFSGIALGLALTLVTSTWRSAIVAALAAGMALAIALSLPAIERRVISGVEAAAKTHSGHVFTIGHAYKLLDAGFYVNPTTPAASTLTLTPGEAARFVLRGLVSFVVVPAPWQLQSTRELAFLPEQLAWFGLMVLLPFGIVAGYRRDRLVTCMLVAYVVPTALALALTNGNVGTLVRLRGLVIPYLAWISVAGFCAALQTAGQREGKMKVIDDRGRLFGRVNLFDAALAAFVVILIPLAYGTFLLFRAPAPRITSVTRVPITREERRVAGGSRLTAKLKVRGTGLRPMLRASIGDSPSLGFVFEDPNSADVLVGEVPPGTHDLVLHDGVQEVARFQKSVTIESAPPPKILGLGALVHLDKATADAFSPGTRLSGGTQDQIIKVGAVRAEPGDRWQRAAEIQLQCDPDPEDVGCAVGGTPVSSTPLPLVVKLVAPSGSQVSFVLNEVLPSTAPTIVKMRVRFAAAPELLNMVKAEDRDDCLDDRAAIVTAMGSRRAGAGGAELDLTLRAGVDESPEGWRYRGRVMKAGMPFTLTTERYVVEGTVLGVDAADQGTK
jgi:hypothetical protein